MGFYFGFDDIRGSLISHFLALVLTRRTGRMNRRVLETEI